MNLKMISELVLVASLAIVTSGGCNKRRSNDTAVIKTTYTNFITGVVMHDNARITESVSSELLRLYRSDELWERSHNWTNQDMQLGKGAWVMFKDRDKAFLFPHRPPVVGSGFVRETNGWKITFDLHPIVDWR